MSCQTQNSIFHTAPIKLSKSSQIATSSLKITDKTMQSSSYPPSCRKCQNNSTLPVKSLFKENSIKLYRTNKCTKNKKERTSQGESPLSRKLSRECTKHPTDAVNEIVTLNLNCSKNSKFTTCLFPSQTKALIGQLALTIARWSISWRNA